MKEIFESYTIYNARGKLCKLLNTSVGRELLREVEAELQKQLELKDKQKLTIESIH